MAPESDDWRTPAILPELFPNLKRTQVPVAGDRFPMVIYDIPPGSRAQIAETPQAKFGDLVNLIKSQYSPQALEPGNPLRLDIVWEVLHPSDVPYKVFVQLLGAPKTDGSPVYAQYDGEPCAKLWHTPSWRPGDLLFDTYSLRIPTDLLPGNYKLEIGWYTETIGERVPVLNSDANTFRLAEFVVK